MKQSKFLTIIAIIFLIPLLIFIFGGFQSVSGHWYNLLMTRSLDSSSPRSDIVLIETDTVSLKKYGPESEWNRDLYGEILKKIAGANPKVIVFDRFFEDKAKSQNIDWNLIARLSGLSADQATDLTDRYDRKVRQTRYLASIDHDFATGMKQYGRVVLPFLFAENPDGTLQNLLKTGQQSIYENVAKLGYANISHDPDGITRTFTRETYGQKSLAQATVDVFSGQHGKYVTPGTEGIQFVSGDTSFPMIAFSDALEGNFMDRTGKKINLQDSIILIWGSRDILYATPIGKNMTSSELLANEIQTLLDATPVRSLATWQYILIISFILCLGSYVFYRLRSLKLSLLVLLVLSITIITLSTKLFAVHVYLDPFPALSAITSPFLIFTAMRSAQAHRQRQRVKRLFSRQVDTSTINSIANSWRLPILTGEKREVTLVYSHIWALTGLSDENDPRTFITTLNTFFDMYGKLVHAHRWTIGKSSLETILSYWWAPLQHANQAALACQTVLEFQRKLLNSSEVFEESFFSRIKNLRFIVNTGMITVGNVGWKHRQEYMIMGETVDLTRYLDQISLYYQTPILATESTKRDLDKHFIVREIDTISFETKKLPIKIYEILGNEKDERLLALKKHHESGLKSYYSRNWYEALCTFVQNESILGDPVAKIFIDRINTFQQNPPPPDWDGSWHFDSTAR